MSTINNNNTNSNGDRINSAQHTHAHHHHNMHNTHNNNGTTAAILVNDEHHHQDHHQHQQQQQQRKNKSSIFRFVPMLAARSSRAAAGGSSTPTPAQQSRGNRLKQQHDSGTTLASSLSSMMMMGTSSSSSSSSAYYSTSTPPSPTTSSTSSSSPLSGYRGAAAATASATIDAANATVDIVQPNNVVQWLEMVCPNDVVPMVLSFCGPQTMTKLSKVNRYWNQCMQHEGTWRIACEQLYKWEQGDPIPKSWKDYYRHHPCVPVDYRSINRALKSISAASDESRMIYQGHGHYIDDNIEDEEPMKITVLVRPGKYVTRESVVVDHNVTVRMMKLPPNIISASHRAALAQQARAQAITPLSTERSRSRSRNRYRNRASGGNRYKCSIRNLLSCGSRSRASTQVIETTANPDYPFDTMNFPGHHAIPFEDVIYNANNAQHYHHQWHQHSAAISPHILQEQQQRVHILLQTRRHNEPIFRVRHGTLHLKDINLTHNCGGVDIWNGNAAVQIQPPPSDNDNEIEDAEEVDLEDNMNVHNLNEDAENDEDDNDNDIDDLDLEILEDASNASHSQIHHHQTPPRRLPPPPPMATLESVDITSTSGRGIVNIDGGRVMINDCCVRDCAATGIYVGGPGSKAEIRNTDVVRNGIGNRNIRRGISAGHSGIYLEQGLAKVIDCNVSCNSLTGISAISPDNCVLWLESSELVSNGSYQLEMPRVGTRSRRNSTTINNKLEVFGVPRYRSTINASINNNNNSNNNASTVHNNNHRNNNNNNNNNSTRINTTAATIHF